MCSSTDRMGTMNFDDDVDAEHLYQLFVDEIHGIVYDKPDTPWVRVGKEFLFTHYYGIVGLLVFMDRGTGDLAGVQVYEGLGKHDDTLSLMSDEVFDIEANYRIA